MKTTPHETVMAEMLANMTETERIEFWKSGKKIDHMLEFAQSVYDARTAAGLSKRELAAEIGADPVLIEDIEAADVVPTLELLEQIANATGKRVHIALV
ncbi:hypothetical protein GCM10027079_10780 [Sediminivirga luteola]|uniref:HTH cro/C1-type domain-containing protein n=2 Tax=Sediminivirga luteola TaxID=1774748 RepID=A0A8J2XL26_9MICO|nr:hypothetical protein GCM10011333_22780 [Sediminivirga luteola]